LVVAFKIKKPLTSLVLLKGHKRHYLLLLFPAWALSLEMSFLTILVTFISTSLLIVLLVVTLWVLTRFIALESIGLLFHALPAQWLITLF
jgi:hypothetical protein